MNIAELLFQHRKNIKQNQPLPFSPTFTLNPNYWYFSSPEYVPLRKKEINTSLINFISKNQDKQSKQISLQSSHMSTMLILQQQQDYRNNMIQHLAIQRHQNLNNKHECECNEESNIYKSVQLYEIQIKQLQKIINKQQNNNKFQISKKIKQLLQNNNINKNNMLIKKKQNITLIKIGNINRIFIVKWRQNYIQFNYKMQNIKLNGQISNHNKIKITEICENIKNCIQKQFQLEYYNKKQNLKQNNYCQMKNNQSYLKNNLKQHKLKIEEMYVWMYKNNYNNQVFAILISNIQFQGWNCILYNYNNFINLKIKYQQYNHYDIRSNNKLEKYRKYELKTNLNNKIIVINNDKKNKIQSQYSNEINEQICQICKNCDMSQSKFIPMRHLPQIQYFRQIKLKHKIDSLKMYDLIQICKLCYKVFLKIHQSKTNKSSSHRKQHNVSFNLKEKNPTIQPLQFQPIKKQLIKFRSPKYVILPKEQKSQILQAKFKNTKQEEEEQKASKIECKRIKKVYSLYSTAINSIKTSKNNRIRDKNYQLIAINNKNNEHKLSISTNKANKIQAKQKLKSQNTTQNQTYDEINLQWKKMAIQYDPKSYDQIKRNKYLNLAIKQYIEQPIKRKCISTIKNNHITLH